MNLYTCMSDEYTVYSMSQCCHNCWKVWEDGGDCVRGIDNWLLKLIV